MTPQGSPFPSLAYSCNMAAHDTLHAAELKPDLVMAHQELLDYEVQNGPATMNVLQALSKSQLLDNVDRFIREEGFEESADTFRRGALVAQQPKNFMNIEQLSDEDRTSLQYEADHKWGQPGTLYFAGKT